ncbi:kinase-like domain-containing protein [Mycena alexandri]|uniref:non-specific serine/threonine protein kinase n=1 Tax=Mycena alexandri TaxID=1745969 RepID=A0AAD6SJG0_9AGAR|nr:kinase-like domain-containing protein [Mycena alexandri]
MDDEEDLQQTQESTQESTQETDDQPRNGQENTSHLWGFLTPCLSQTLARRDLLKDEPDVAVGRNVANAFVLPGYKISNFHAVIRWNGLENAESIITIDDLSSNGTFINGEKIGKGQRRLLKDGNEVAFGAPSTSREADGLFDYRYIFRDLVSFVPKRPVYQAYDISIELGKGSFATVYKALHIASGEWVAVKVIRETKRHNTNPNSTAPPPASSREINIMEELQHPNICGLREVFWNPNGSIDLVLELVTGGDLLDFILTRNGLDEATAKHITYQLCQALAYIHGKGITHRDLKPENVLLTSDTPPIVKVADFGLAKIVDSMTMLKTMCGTPSYLAPEVVTQQGSSGYDSLVDSWSVGVILFSMLTNTTPFIETSHEDLKVRIAERTIDWSQLEGVGLSAEVISFIRNLLEFDPRRRMRLSSALAHPWLEGYELQVAVPLVYPALERTTPDASGGGGMLSEDVSMRTAGSFVDVEAPVLTPREGEGMGEDDVERGEEADAVSQGIEHLRINGSVPSVTAPTDATTPPPSNTPPGLTLLNRTRGRGVLQRRSEVIQHAAETGRVLVEPSWEMVSYASSQNQQNQQQAQEDDALSPSQEELYGPPREGDACVVPMPTTNGAASKNANAKASGSGTTTTNGNGKGPNKRVRAELTPLTEDGEDEHEHEGGTRASSPLSSVGETPPPAGPARKKSRANASQSQESPLNKPAPTKGRRTAKGAAGAGAGVGATRKVRGKVDGEGEETPVGTRRSTRARSGKR